MSGSHVLALDVGTSSVRAHRFGAAADERGEPAQRDYTSELDPDRIVAWTREAIEEAGGANGADAVGASCFGHSLLALDKRGRPLTPIMSWRDTRSADAADWLLGRLDNHAIHARTGCHIHTSYWPAKLAWLAQEKQDVFRAAHRFVSFCDYLYAQLLGREVPTSISMASPTGLVDLRTRTWDEELLGTLGLDPERLPEISDAPVDGWYPALLDGACSNLGAGCVTGERAALMIGTSGAIRTVYELSDGGNLYAWIDQTLEDSDGSLADRDPSSHGLTFLSLLGGERSPGWHQHARGAVHGLTFDTTPLDLRQAGLEGVAFRFAEVADLMPWIEEIVVTGGALLKDPDWVQLMADALGRPVTTSGVKEASLRGAAVVVLERLGETPAPAPLGAVVEPRPDKVDLFRAARERQRRLYEVVTSEPTS